MLVCMIRSIILYFLLIVAVRLMGKRQIGELEPSEFVIAMLIADLASVPMQDLGIPLLSGVIPIFTVLAIEILLSVLSYHFIAFRKLLCGTPIILMEAGRILHENMKKTRVTTDELMEQLREKGFLDLSKIQFAILETNGQISAFLYPTADTPTKEELQIKPDKAGIPVTLISNGRMIRENMAAFHFTDEAVRQLLADHGLTLDNVFLLTYDGHDHFYYSTKQEAP